MPRADPAPGWPRLDGRTVLVTGATAGIGYFAAEGLARLGASVVIAARSPERAAAAVASIGAQVPGAVVRHIPLDLSSLASAHDAAAHLARLPHLDAVVANAAVVGLPDYLRPRPDRGPRPRTTRDGIELFWGTNHLGHFALIAGLMPLLLASGARVVHVGSISYTVPRQPADSVPSPDEPQSDLHKYARSKLAAMAFGFELARRFTAAGAEARSVVVHPGTAMDVLSPARDGVAVNQPASSPALRPFLPLIGQGKEAAAEPLVAAVASPDVGNGEYWGPGGAFGLRGRPARLTPRPTVLDRGAGSRLVAASEELSGVRLGI
jgi:NAD(P)-dependent dehydrogenase (short-subunit alcohol dehydrogenase family)